MSRSHALALSSAALFLAFSAPSSAQSIAPGRQCVPALADTSMYHNCRLHMVQGQAVCRCAIRPQAMHRMDRLNSSNQNDAVTGSIGSRPSAGPGVALPGSGTLGTVNNGRTGTVGTVGGAGQSRGGAVADSGTSGGGNSTNSGAGNTGSAGGSADAGGTSSSGGTGNSGSNASSGSNAGSGSGNGNGNGGHGNGNAGGAWQQRPWQRSRWQ
jgi:hypothetical protein